MKLQKQKQQQRQSKEKTGKQEQQANSTAYESRLAQPQTGLIIFGMNIIWVNSSIACLGTCKKVSKNDLGFVSE